MSRLETGIIQIQKERENLYQTLTAAVSQIVPAAAQKEIELYVECEENMMLNYDKMDGRSEFLMYWIMR